MSGSAISENTGKASAQQKNTTEIVVLTVAAFILLAGVANYYCSRVESSLIPMALKIAEYSPGVKSVLGEPIRARRPIQWAPSDDGVEEAKLNVPIYGSKGQGELRIVADKGARTWVFSHLEFIPLDHSQAVIDALADASAISRPAQDGSHPSLVVSLDSHSGKRSPLIDSIEPIRPTLRHDRPINEFEVDLQTGAFILRQTDLFLPGSPPIALTRTYHSFAYYTGGFGKAASHPYDIWPTGTRNPYTETNLNLEDGSQVYYRRISDGTGYADAVYRHDQTASEFYRSQFFWNGNGWTLRLPDQRKILFPEAYNAKTVAQSGPTEMDDETGNRVFLKRDTERKLEALVSSGERKITFKYNGSGEIVEAQDNQGRSRKYEYESTSHVRTVLDGEQPIYRFTYERVLDAPGVDPFGMTAVEDGIGREILHLTYDGSGRVIAETLADGKVFRFDYSYVNENGNARQATTLTYPNGKRKTVLF